METGSLSVVFLFLSSLHLFFSMDLGPVQMASAWVFTTCHWRWSFPVRWINRKVAIELYRSVVGLMGSYNCVRRMIVSFFVSLSFSSLLIGFRPSTNGVGTGFYHLRSQSSGDGFSQCAGSAEWSP